MYAAQIVKALLGLQPASNTILLAAVSYKYLLVNFDNLISVYLPSLYISLSVLFA